MDLLTWLKEERGLSEVLAKDLVRGITAFEKGKPWYSQSYLFSPDYLMETNLEHFPIPKEYGILIIGSCGDGDHIVLDSFSDHGSIGYLRMGEFYDFGEYLKLVKEIKQAGVLSENKSESGGIEEPLKSVDKLRGEIVNISENLPGFLKMLREGRTPWDYNEAVEKK